MSRDDAWVRRVRETLEADVERLDRATLDALRRRRASALARRRTRSRWLPDVATGAGVAAAAIVVAVLAGLPRGLAPQPGTDVLLFEVALAEDEIELIEDLEFIRWLDASGHAG